MYVCNRPVEVGQANILDVSYAADAVTQPDE